MYDGESHPASATTKVNGTTIEYSTDGENWSPTAPSITNVGEQAVQVRASNSNYETATAECTLKVDPKTVTITANDNWKYYGDPEPTLTATVDGLIGNDTIDYTLKRDPGEEVGTYKIHVNVTAPTKRVAVGNYDVETVEGEFTIKPAIITIGDGSEYSINDLIDYLYDGDEHKQGITLKRGETQLIEGTDFDLTYRRGNEVTSDFINAGTIRITITGTNNYGGVVDLQFKINPRKVVLTSESAEKRYDGEPLTRPDVTITGDGFVEGEVAEIMAIGTITKPGSVTNTITYTEGESFNANNYNITLMEGTLSVYKPSGDYNFPELNTEDHIAYVIGYEDETVRPENNITRAEVAMIFFRLLTDETRDAALTEVNSYSDVAAGDWYNTAVSTMSALGIIKGYPDGTFKPNNFITRAEFAAIAARFDNHTSTGAVSFSDLEDHWAAEEVSRAAELGWVNGYPDGTFRPDQYITRAEAMALINRVLVRNPETVKDLLEDMPVWKDNMDTRKWYYIDVQEASIGHEYARKPNNTEYWTGLRADTWK